MVAESDHAGCSKGALVLSWVALTQVAISKLLMLLISLDAAGSDLPSLPAPFLSTVN